MLLTQLSLSHHLHLSHLYSRGMGLLVGTSTPLFAGLEERAETAARRRLHSQAGTPDATHGDTASEAATCGAWRWMEHVVRSWK